MKDKRHAGALKIEGAFPGPGCVFAFAFGSKTRKAMSAAKRSAYFMSFPLKKAESITTAAKPARYVMIESAG